MPGLKTNERPGTRAVLRHSHMSAYKAREVLDLIRGVDFVRAVEILELTDRGAADVIEKLLRSCAANALHNDLLDPEELFVSACFADEGTTLKRWRPRARGRATRIRKRTCHITVILSRLPDEEIARRRARTSAEQSERRQRRVAATRRGRRGADTAAELAVEEAAAEAEAVEAATEAAIEARESETTDEDEGETEVADESTASVAEDLEADDDSREAEADSAAEATAAAEPEESDASTETEAEDDEDASDDEPSDEEKD